MGPPKFLPSLYSRATTPNPDGPSKFKPYRTLRVGFRFPNSVSDRIQQ